MIYNHKKLNTTRTPEVINKISWKPECITQPSLFEFGLFGSMRSSTAWVVDEKYDFDQSEAGFHTVIHVLSLTLFPFPFALDYDAFRVYVHTLLSQDGHLWKYPESGCNRWNIINIIHIYVVQCEIMQKIWWKSSNGQIHSLQGEISSAVLKTCKTRKTKTLITQFKESNTYT